MCAHGVCICREEGWGKCWRCQGGAKVPPELGRTGPSELSPEGTPSNVGLTQIFVRGGLLNKAHDLHLHAVALRGSCTHSGHVFVAAGCHRLNARLHVQTHVWGGPVTQAEYSKHQSSQPLARFGMILPPESLGIGTVMLTVQCCLAQLKLGGA